MIEWSFYDSRKAPFHKNGHLCRAVGLSKYITTNSDDKVPDPELFAPEHRNTILAPSSNPTPYMHKSQKVQWCQHEVHVLQKNSPLLVKEIHIGNVCFRQVFASLQITLECFHFRIGCKQRQAAVYKTLLKGRLPTEA